MAAPPSWNGHAALASHQQHRSNIEDRAAPPLFRVGSRVAKCVYVLVKTLPWSARRSWPEHFRRAESAERFFSFDVPSQSKHRKTHQRVPQHDGGGFCAEKGEPGRGSPSCGRHRGRACLLTGTPPEKPADLGRGSENFVRNIFVR